MIFKLQVVLILQFADLSTMKLSIYYSSLKAVDRGHHCETQASGKKKEKEGIKIYHYMSKSDKDIEKLQTTKWSFTNYV